MADNILLNALPPADRQSVLASCQHVLLRPGDVLCEQGQPNEHVVFVESGFLSVMTGEVEREQVEIGLVGREGMTGLSLALGASASPFRIIVQAEGAGYRMTASAFTEACAAAPSLLSVALRYSLAFTTQLADTCRANARQTVESRLARWLLMAHDRVSTDELCITHDTLSLMLGVRRPGVTVSLHVLEGEHMIKATRGRIRILDREKLAEAAKGSYGQSERELHRFFPAGSEARAAA